MLMAAWQSVGIVLGVSSIGPQVVDRRVAGKRPQVWRNGRSNICAEVGDQLQTTANSKEEATSTERGRCLTPDALCHQPTADHLTPEPTHFGRQHRPQIQARRLPSEMGFSVPRVLVG